MFSKVSIRGFGYGDNPYWMVILDSLKPASNCGLILKVENSFT